MAPSQLYPDGGLVWDGQARVWKEDNGGTSSLAWPDQVMAAARASQTSPVWAGCFVGGCCKATTADIAALRARIDAVARGAADTMV